MHAHTHSKNQEGTKAISKDKGTFNNASRRKVSTAATQGLREIHTLLVTQNWIGREGAAGPCSQECPQVTRTVQQLSLIYKNTLAVPLLPKGGNHTAGAWGSGNNNIIKNKTMKTAVTTITNCPINLIKRTQLYGDCNGLRSVVSQFSPPTNSLLESTVENRGDRKGRKIKCHKGQPRLPRPSRKDLETKLDSKEMVLL